MALAYAALHRLPLPLEDQIATLPPGQRKALQTSFGFADYPSSDRFLVSLAALTLLTEAAATQPVCCLVDDTQWIDRESREVLSFIGRRLDTDAVALVLAIREGHDGPPVPEGLPALAVGPLDTDSARELLVERAVGRVGAGTCYPASRRDRSHRSTTRVCSPSSTGYSSTVSAWAWSSNIRDVLRLVRWASQ